ncbi:MAG: xanthine dehydrogenase family protein subunit M [Rhizobiaceae bacterium]|nr:MAG: xanthine dehydrogenase family protein subunit M [Rhizobiaceae bacterium]CAG1008556.1 aerobic carbon-monoxide dehydrogenase medium subunit [Rhizobiaceae bacterium]
MTRYARPETVEEALHLLGDGVWRILAGGTDFYPSLGDRPVRDHILDVSALAALRGIGETDAGFVFGAATRWIDIARHDLPPAFDALRQAAREVGSIQIQNAGTIGGNLCNASPAADGVPALMVLDATVEVRSRESTRHLGLSDFILGNRRTALRPGEMVTAVNVPKRAARGRSAFVKLGARRYLVISIAMAAARIEAGPDGTIANAAVSVGACSAVAQRLGFLEDALVGRPIDGDLGEAVHVSDFAALSPIDDVRGSAAYRREAAVEIVRRAVRAAAARPASGELAA